MKNNLLIKLITVFVICFLAVSSFGQRKGSFGGGRMGGGRPAYHAPIAPPRQMAPVNIRPPMGGGRPANNMMSVNKTQGSFGVGQNTAPRQSAPMGAGRPANRPLNRVPMNAGRVNSVSNFRPGYRLPSSVNYFGNPYRYNGLRIYWYGHGFYSTYPGGPLIMGNPMMPGYRAAYGYNPYATSSPFGIVLDILGVFVLLLLFFIILRAVTR
jgi:hypothetical protein